MEFQLSYSNPKRWRCESATLNMPANVENSAVATGLEKVRSVFIPIPKKGNAKEFSICPHTRTHTHKGERLWEHILALPLSSLACSFSWGLSITLTFWVSGYTPPLVPVSPGVWRWLWSLLANKLLRYVTSCWCLGVMLPSYSCWGNLKLEFLHFRVYKVSITLVN